MPDIAIRIRLDLGTAGYSWYEPVLRYARTDGAGCFMKVLSNFQIVAPRVVWSAEKDGRSKTLTSYVETTAVENDFYVKRQDKELLSTLVTSAARILGDTEQDLSVFGDALIEHSVYYTSEVLQSLVSLKIGHLYPGPAIINPNHADAPRLCQGWFWVPPKLMGTVVLPGKLNKYKSLSDYMDQTRHCHGYTMVPAERYIPWYVKNLFRKRELKPKKEV